MQIFYDVLHLIWLAGLTYSVLKLYERIEPIQEKQTESIDDAWSPVELTDDREFEMQEIERRRDYFKV